MKKILAFIAFFVLSMLMLLENALAYIDPSAMTFIIQLIAGVAIAAGAAVGFYWRKIKRAVKKKKNNEDDDEEYEDDEEDDEE